MKKALSVCGIDPSSQRIVAVESRRDRSGIIIREVYLNAERIEDRQLQAFDFIVEMAMEIRERDGQSPRLYLEEPVEGQGGPHATIVQAYVDGSIMSAAAQTECWISLVHNKTWKKHALKNGNVKKSDIEVEIKKVWRELYDLAPVRKTKQFPEQADDAKDQDVLDAGGINLFGWRHTKIIEGIMRRKNG